MYKNKHTGKKAQLIDTKTIDDVTYYVLLVDGVKENWAYMSFYTNWEKIE